MSDTTLTPEQVCSRLSAWARAAGVASPRCGEGALGVWKSDLLLRLIFGKEKGPSQTPCPAHEGRWSGMMFSDPECPDPRVAEWRAKGCRCDMHNGSDAFTGWNPDAACGCVSEADREAGDA